MFLLASEVELSCLSVAGGKSNFGFQSMFVCLSTVGLDVVDGHTVGFLFLLQVVCCCCQKKLWLVSPAGVEALRRFSGSSAVF